MKNGELIDFLSQFPREKEILVNVKTFYHKEYSDITDYPEIESVTTTTKYPNVVFIEGTA